MLSSEDLRTLLGCTRRLYEASTLDAFPARLVGVVRELIAGEYAVVEEMNLARQRTTGYSDPPEARPVDDPVLMAAFERNMHAHPLIAHFAATKCQQGMTISDFVSRADWLRGAFFHEFYRVQGGIEDQLGVFVASRGGLTVAIGVGRTRRTFSRRDRQLLTLLQPHIEQAYRNAELLTDLDVTTAALTEELDAGGQGVVRMGEGGGVKSINAAARRALELFFPGWARRPDRGTLPAPLAARLAEHRTTLDGGRPAATLDAIAFDAPPGRLEVRRVLERGGSVLILRHHRPAAAVPVLPQRLRDVLGLLRAGLSEKQIARRLDLSQHTVHRHVARLYRRLGVAGRGELLAIWAGDATPAKGFTA